MFTQSCSYSGSCETFRPPLCYHDGESSGTVGVVSTFKGNGSKGKLILLHSCESNFKAIDATQQDLLKKWIGLIKKTRYEANEIIKQLELARNSTEEDKQENNKKLMKFLQRVA